MQPLLRGHGLIERNIDNDVGSQELGGIQTRAIGPCDLSFWRSGLLILAYATPSFIWITFPGDTSHSMRVKEAHCRPYVHEAVKEPYVDETFPKRERDACIYI
jgi:hypothetical protein